MGKIALAQPTPPPHVARTRLVGSDQQEAFWGELVRGSSHVLLEARAGTGKSTSCQEGMWRLFEADPGLAITYLCFNAKIAEDFRRRGLPPGCQARTMHSLGRAACTRAFECGDPYAEKTFFLLDQVHGHDEPIPPLKRKIRAAVNQLVGKAKNTLTPAQPDDLAALAWFYDVEVPAGYENEVFGLANEVLERSAAQTTLIDFDDMLWLPRVHMLRFPRCDVLFVDEAQDLNRLQQELIGLICPRGRVVIVGDRHQAIYGFRGADCRSIPRLEEMLGSSSRGLVKLPLTMTRRCPKSHVRLARQIVPDLEAMAEAPGGRIDEEYPVDRVLDEATPGEPGADPEWLILCRTNAPLVSACLKLIGRGKRAAIRGRNIGDGLIRLVESFRARDMEELARKLDEWARREISKLGHVEGPGAEIEAVQDKVACVKAVAWTCEGPRQVLAAISDLFRDDEERGRIVLSSVHRAKGSEARTVAILRPDLMPHPAAKRDWELDQERNIEYVAYTRSKHRLILCEPPKRRRERMSSFDFDGPDEPDDFTP